MHYQMVLLWRDPEGKNIVSTMKNNSTPTQNNDKDLQRITSLEKSIKEKDGIIANLKDEIITLKEVNVTIQ